MERCQGRYHKSVCQGRELIVHNKRKTEYKAPMLWYMSEWWINGFHLYTLNSTQHLPRLKMVKIFEIHGFQGTVLPSN